MKRSKSRRLLYRQGYTPAELDQLVAEIGPEPLTAALTGGLHSVRLRPNKQTVTLAFTGATVSNILA